MPTTWIPREGGQWASSHPLLASPISQVLIPPPRPHRPTGSTDFYRHVRPVIQVVWPKGRNLFSLCKKMTPEGEGHWQEGRRWGSSPAQGVNLGEALTLSGL